MRFVVRRKKQQKKIHELIIGNSEFIREHLFMIL